MLLNKKIISVICLFLLSLIACESKETKDTPLVEVSQLEQPSKVDSVRINEDIDTIRLTINQRTHLFRTGQTLWDLCQTYYGNRHYSSVVALYNDIEDVNRIKDSTVI